MFTIALLGVTTACAFLSVVLFCFLNLSNYLSIIRHHIFKTRGDPGVEKLCTDMTEAGTFSPLADVELQNWPIVPILYAISLLSAPGSRGVLFDRFSK